MLEIFRNRFGAVFSAVIIGFIAFVFIFFGVYSPATRGMMGAGGSAAVVNGEAITVSEFARAYEQRIQFYQSMMKGKADPALLAKLGLKKAVLDDLARQKAVLQEAKKMGFVVSDIEIASKVKTMPYFQKDGRFDRELYANMLKANGFSAGKFEDMLRDDLVQQKLQDFFRGRVKASAQEIKQEFLDNSNQRQLDYVVVTQEKETKALAEAVAGKVKAGDAALKAFLKDKKLEKRNTGKFSASQSFIPGLGEVVELQADAFKSDSPIKSGVKVYENRGMYVVAWNLKEEKLADKDFDKEKDKFAQQVVARKDREFYENWSKEVVARAKIKLNDNVLAEETEEGSGAMPMPSGPVSEEI